MVLCDARTGAFKRSLEGPGVLWSVAISPDGKTVAAGGREEIRVWDAESGHLQRTLVGHTSDVTAVVFSPDGKTLAGTGGDNTIILWDTQTWEVKRTVNPGMARALAFSPGGSMLAVAGGGTIRLLDTQTGAVLFRTAPQNNYHPAATFAPSDDFLASACMDGTVNTWKLESPTQAEKEMAEQLRQRRLERRAAPPQETPAGLRASISINEPTFRDRDTSQLMIFFALVNDGPRAIAPGIESSRIMVNGKELADSALIFGNGPRGAHWDSLPPGENILFGKGLGRYFETPGVYRVSWRGENYQSPEIVFRVLPRKVR